MICRKCGTLMIIEDITRAGTSSILYYECVYCGSSCTSHIKGHKRTEHWFIQTDDGTEYLKVETNKKEQK